MQLSAEDEESLWYYATLESVSSWVHASPTLHFGIQYELHPSFTNLWAGVRLSRPLQKVALPQTMHAAFTLTLAERKACESDFFQTSAPTNAGITLLHMSDTDDDVVMTVVEDEEAVLEAEVAKEEYEKVSETVYER